jgi:hypothetical protein
MRHRRWITVALTALLAGCASTATPDGAEGRGRIDRNRITAEEIEAATRHNSAFEMVQGLRPAWLRSGRGGATISNPNAGAVVVYLDGVRMGGSGVLQQIPRRDVVSLQYLDRNDATTRFGTGHTGGVILVSTRQAR